MNKGLLEKFSGAAAAYSVRLLNRQYTGALMKVRRVDSVTSQDNGEIFVFPDDTGWVSLNSKVVDPSHASAATTLGEFVQASGFAQPDKETVVLTANTQHAYVVVWKDQSGNSNDASQGTTTAQPQIVSSGSLIVENGKPAVSFNGTEFFAVTVALSVSQSQIMVTTPSSVSNKYITGDGNNHAIITAYSGTKIEMFNAPRFTLSTTPSGLGLIEAFFDATTYAGFYNGTAEGSGTYTNIATNLNAIGAGSAVGLNAYSGKMSEFILYSTDQSSNRTNIEEDINTAFNIYNNAPTPKKNSFLGKYPGAAAAYSTRNLTGKTKQPLLKVRRELGTDTDTEETIYSSNNQLDTNQLLNFVNGVSEDPRPPLDISEGYGYSLRIVKSGYQGPLVEVRESSGNTTKDFYADSTGRINEQALLDFCGSNDGHVSKWYNQSGADRHLTSDAAANEPKIVESGVVVKDTLGNVALKFTTAGNEFLAIQDATAFDLQEQTIAMHFMSTALPASGTKRILGLVQPTGSTFDSTIRNNVTIQSGTGYLILSTGTSTDTLTTIPQSVNTPSILTLTFKGGDSSGTSNKTLEAATLVANDIKGLSVGARFTVTSTPDFLTSEVIQYTSAQIGDNKNEVEASLNKQYKIYGDAYVSTWYDQSTAASDNLLLDDNPDAAAAYSLRKLRTLYQGSAINVRRDSDNATKNIGFTASGELDVDDIINFCAGSNGFVTTWYNQAFTSKNELLLDTAEGADAAAAYSVRQLSSTATECMVIRRSSDGKTRTIGFRDTHIDEAEIESFCSGTTCTVQTWKDQSGNSNDATQTDHTKQPTIYTGGAIVKENGRVAVDFDGASNFLESGALTTATQPISVITTTTPQATAFSGGIVNTTDSNNFLDFYRNDGGFAINAGTTLTSGASVDYVQDNQYLRFSLFNGASSEIFANGVSVVSGNANTTGLSGNLFIGKFLTSSDNYMDGLIQEAILYASDKSTDRTDIESNINNYYGIFSTNNAEQDVATNQPKIYDSSTGVVTKNGKPAIYTERDSNSSGDKLVTPATTWMDSNLEYACMTVFTPGVGNSGDTWVWDSSGGGTNKAPSIKSVAGVGIQMQALGTTNAIVAVSAAGQAIRSAYLSSGTLEAFYNGGSAGTAAAAGTYNASIQRYIGSRIGGSEGHFDGYFQELIWYANDQSSRRLNIEGNINNHYRIYSINDASQATATSQPQLVSNGRVILENGRPAVDFDGTDDNLQTSSVIISGTTGRSLFSVVHADVTNDDDNIISLVDASTGTGSVFNYTIETAVRVAGFKSWTNDPMNVQTLGSIHLIDNGNVTDADFYKNGTLATSDGESGATINTSSTGVSSIGKYPAGTGTELDGRIQELILYPSDQSSNRIGIESSINRAFGIYWDGTQRGLLDDQPNAAAAYSVRALSSSYTGPLIEIRDSNGNTTDIYATYNGDLDEAAIETFCSGSTCTIATWYDQSGNANDATQADALSQPTIYASGAIVKENGKPAVDFDGTNDSFDTSWSAGDTSAFTAFNIASPTNNTTSTQLYDLRDGNDDGLRLIMFSDSNLFYSASANDLRTTAYVSGQQLVYSNYASSTIATGIDGATVDTGSAPATTSVTANATLFRDGVGDTFYFNGKAQEAIFYTSDQSTNRTNIERNINQYFNIYTDPGLDRLLNKFPGAAAAYSLRKLNSQYTGPAVRVRRDSDGVHADVYFDLNSTISKYSRVGVLSSSTDPIAAASSTTLQTFMGSNNGFVSVWYDQASSNNASQSSATAQPKIYDSSTGVITENGKPTVKFEGSKAMYIGNYSSLTEGELFTTVRWLGDVTTRGGFKISTQSQIMHFPYYGGPVYDNFGSTSRYSFTPSITLNQLNLYNTLSTSNEWTARLNSNVETTSSTNTVGFSTGTIGSFTMDHNFSEFIIYSSVQSSGNRTGIEDNINNHYSIYPKRKKLLDQYGGAAAAYSLRSLQSNYTGPLVTIRRDSDGIEVDVYADLNGEFSLNSIVKNVAETTTGATQGTFKPGTPFITLSQFVQGSPNCYVIEWKDQSGNGNHATQNTAANQPKIYDGTTASVVTENGKPAVDFGSSTNYLNYTDSFTGTKADFSIYAVSKTISTGTKQTIWGEETSFLLTPNGGFRINAGIDNISMTPAVVNAQELRTANLVESTADYVVSVNGTATSGTGTWTTISRGSNVNLGRRSNNSWFFSGLIQEVVVYQSDQSSNRTNIEDNINTFYSIY